MRQATIADAAPRPGPSFIQTGWAVCLGWLMGGIWLPELLTLRYRMLGGATPRRS